MIDHTISRVEEAVNTLLDARIELQSVKEYVLQLEQHNEDLAYQVMDLEHELDEARG